ncbi:MAG: AraC family transcriptional regulator [Planctomycetota bacterium]
MTDANDWRERIGRARALVESRLDEKLTLEQLAATAHFSEFHFHRLFRAAVGETDAAHARRLRLERAASRLVGGDDEIVRVALDAGFESHEGFTRAFKARFGVAPSVFREERRSVIAERAKEVMAMELRIERREPCRIAFVRHEGPYGEVGTAWATLMKWGWTKMMFGKPDTFGLCFDDPDVTPAERLRYEACMVVDAKAKVKGEVRSKDLAGGTYAVGVHEGSFETIGETYAGLCAQVASEAISGKQWTLGDPPSMEVYLTDPRKTEPEDLRTEVWMPVA